MRRSMRSPRPIGSPGASPRCGRRLAQVIYGQQQVVGDVLVCLLSGGHGLLVGAPGLGKTLLVETLGTVLGLAAKRVQFTPDLMPADITGSEILEETQDGRRGFRFVPGPVFCQLLMADEINRAKPRARSRRCCRRCRSIGWRWRASTIRCHGRSMCWRRRTRSSRRGHIPCRRLSSTASLLQIDLTYPDEADERAMLLATTAHGPGWRSRCSAPASWWRRRP